MPNLWYKNAVIYCLDVESFNDGNGDGIGDFIGLTERLDYLERLGVTCLWLNPFYPSPNRDNGYDITDYYGVDPRYGSFGDFVEFMQAAEDRGLRVIIDLVVNHTSVEHPWFQAARADPKSPYRDWYVWSDEKPANAEEGIVFPGVQKAIWNYDRKAGAWYLHRFYDHQADLNTTNPAVRAEILKIMGFWLQLGVSGFRVDAVPFLIESTGIKTETPPDPFSLLTEMHDFLAWRRAGAVLLAEANIAYNDAPDYFDHGDRMSMILDFVLNQQLALAFVRETAAPVRHTLADRREPGGTGQWANFLRNHDELSLDRLSKQEQGEVFAQWGPDATMQVYDRGIRRRLAPMLGNDPARLGLAYSVMLALPGTPVFWYGEEIGMGEDLTLTEREAVRTPMQWSDGHHGGFSAAQQVTGRPVQPDGEFGYRRTNVMRQLREPGSLLRMVMAMIGARRSAPEIGWGSFEMVDTGDDDVLVLRYRWKDREIMTFHNFTRQPKTIPLGEDPAVVFEPMLDEDGLLDPLQGDAEVSLSPFGYCWLRKRMLG